jgi:hypothetical protein
MSYIGLKGVMRHGYSRGTITLTFSIELQLVGKEDRLFFSCKMEISQFRVERNY